MKRRFRRTPKAYAGVQLTGHKLNEILPSVLYSIGLIYKERGDLVLAAWPEIIGDKLALMTEAVSFDAGILYVKVRNSTLFSLLKQHDKPQILRSLRGKFPRTNIKNIVFRMG
jgi:hypothetical protein